MAVAAKAKEALTRKLGPLPLWAWVVVGLAVFFVWRRFSSGTGGDSTDAGATDGSLDGGAMPSGGGGFAGDGMSGVAEGNGLGVLGDLLGAIRANTKAEQANTRATRDKRKPKPKAKPKAKPKGKGAGKGKGKGVGVGPWGSKAFGAWGGGFR